MNRWILEALDRLFSGLPTAADQDWSPQPLTRASAFGAHLGDLSAATLAARPLAMLAPATPPRVTLAALSEREREVLARMEAGDSNKLIARAFDLSPPTVKRHIANILDELGVATRGQAAARWREQAGS